MTARCLKITVTRLEPSDWLEGDMRRGQNLVVWAINEGREAAQAVDEYLMGESVLEMKEKGILALR